MLNFLIIINMAYELKNLTIVTAKGNDNEMSIKTGKILGLFSFSDVINVSEV